MPPPTDHQRIKALFTAVCDLPDAKAQRAALAALGANEASNALVLALLRHDRGEAPLPARWRRWLALNWGDE
jgi:hypothetical protein